ncbi:MAG: hypothetical protein JWQ38_2990 [Flavipsychrobacter sp.]|nr:hypothetical protein [Flavipsychrobacter sp.]
MDNPCKKILLVFALIFMSTFGFSQPGQIRVRFIGNCGLYMTDGTSNIYFDFPYKSGAFGYMKYDRSALDSIKDNSAFLFTHRHPDHYSKKLVNKFNGKAYGPWNKAELEKLSSSIPGFSIQPFKTKHRFASKHNSYLVTWHGKRIYISGDTEHADTIAAVHGIDWAFVPSWIVTDAWERQLKIDTKKIAVYHLYPNEQFNVDNPEKIILLDKQGKVIDIAY